MVSGAGVSESMIARCFRALRDTVSIAFRVVFREALVFAKRKGVIGADDLEIGAAQELVSPLNINTGGHMNHHLPGIAFPGPFDDSRQESDRGFSAHQRIAVPPADIKGHHGCEEFVRADEILTQGAKDEADRFIVDLCDDDGMLIRIVKGARGHPLAFLSAERDVAESGGLMQFHHKWIRRIQVGRRFGES